MANASNRLSMSFAKQDWAASDPPYSKNKSAADAPRSAASPIAERPFAIPWPFRPPEQRGSSMTAPRARRRRA